MKKLTNVISTRKNFSFFSIGILLLSSFILLSFENSDENVVSDNPETVLICCEAPLPSTPIELCPGETYILTFPITGGCTNFTMLRNTPCSGINYSVSSSSSTDVVFTVSVDEDASESACPFRYELTDPAGNTCTYKTGFKILPANGEVCCTEEPCQ